MKTFDTAKESPVRDEAGLRFENEKNHVFLARNRSRSFLDMGESAIDSSDVCLSYEMYKPTFRQH